MSSAPTQVILAAFKDEYAADAALEQLKRAKKEHLIDIENVAVLRCDREGKVHISEPTDMGGRRGAAIGGIVGGLAGLLFGPIALAAVGGAAIGGTVAKLRDSGFDDARLRKLGESLQPGTSAILAVIEHVWVTELEAELQRAGAEVVTQELASDIATELRSGHNVAYTAVVIDDAVVAARATDAAPTSTEATAPAPTSPPAASAPTAPTRSNA